MQFQGEKDEIRRELEKTIRETHLSSSLKEKEIIDLEERNKELSDKLYRKKEKYSDSKKVQFLNYTFFYSYREMIH